MIIATNTPIKRSLFDNKPKYSASVGICLVTNFNIDDNAMKTENAPKQYKTGCNFDGIIIFEVYFRSN